MSSRYQIHRKVKVRNGYEVTATLTDGEYKRTKHFFYQGEIEPSDENLAPKLDTMLERYIEKNEAENG